MISVLLLSVNNIGNVELNSDTWTGGPVADPVV